MPTPYERLRAICNSRDPSRLVLEVGTDVRIGEQVWKLLTKETDVSEEVWECVWSPFATVTHTTNLLYGHSYEILGREVSLSDVLMTLQRASYGYVLDQRGHLSLARGTSAPKSLRVDIYLPVSQWPDATLTSVIGLIE